MSRLDLDKGKSLRDSVSSEQLDKDNDKDNNKNNKVRPEKILYWRYTTKMQIHTS